MKLHNYTLLLSDGRDERKTNCQVQQVQVVQHILQGNVPRCIPTFSDLEVVAFSITAEALSIDSENNLFNLLNAECPYAIIPLR